jgi:hypothetical protein
MDIERLDNIDEKKLEKEFQNIQRELKILFDEYSKPFVLDQSNLGGNCQKLVIEPIFSFEIHATS